MLITLIENVTYKGSALRRSETHEVDQDTADRLFKEGLAVAYVEPVADEAPQDSSDPKTVRIAELKALKAEGQKKLIQDLQIKTDASNEDQRIEAIINHEFPEAK